MSEEPLFPHLRKAWPFGCLTVGLLASGIGSIVLMGNLLSTCDSSIGCAETHILAGLGWALLIASSFAAPIWLVYPSAGTFTTNFFSDVRGGSYRAALLQPCRRPSIQDR